MRQMTRPEPDHAVVARAVAGDPPPYMTVAEREAAVAQLNEQGLSDAEIAVRIRITDRSVYRIRLRRGITPARAAGSGRRLKGAAA